MPILPDQVCPDCNKKIRIFNGENTNKFLQEMNLRLLGELPMLSSICNLSSDDNEDTSEDLDSIFNPIANSIIKSLED